MIQAYIDYRLPDVQAMTGIAAEHFHELKNGVPPKTEMLRKFVESKLQTHVPALDYKPFYSRIVFGHERFSVAIRKDRIQKTLFNLLFSGMCLLGLLITVFRTWSNVDFIRHLTWLLGDATIRRNSVISRLFDRMLFTLLYLAKRRAISSHTASLSSEGRVQ